MRGTLSATVVLLLLPFSFAQGYGGETSNHTKSDSQRHGIENRRWRIAKYRGGDAKHSDRQGLVDATEPAEITFTDGQVRGSPGCGALVGTYRLSGERLTVHAGVALAGICGIAQDGPVMDDFKGELRIEYKKDHILLRDTTGKARILLVPY